MKKVILLLNDNVGQSGFLHLGDRLTEFLASDTESVLPIRNSSIEKITVLDVNDEFRDNQAEQLQILRKSRLQPNGVYLQGGEKVVTENGLCTFKEYKENHIVSDDGYMHYKVIRLATEEDLKPKEELLPTHQTVKKKRGSFLFWLFGRG